MRRDIAGLRLRRGLTAALAAALAAGLAGCGSAGGTAANGASGSASASAAATGSDRQASSGHAARDPLAHSRLKVLTTLSQARLCSVLSPAGAAKILGAAAQAPSYAKLPNLGVVCRWLKQDVAVTSTDELYVGISATIDWAGAQQVDKLLHATSTRVGADPALTIARLPATQWAQVDVALGGAGDPVAEYRAPTLAQALTLARMATPHLLALG
jgi:hypothetical protein